jgi:K(+)-stimulated pyrophosphate-energized sodium pump
MAKRLFSIAVFLFSPSLIFAGEQNLKIPTLTDSQSQILIWGLLVCVMGLGFGFYQFLKVKKIRAHKSMLDVAGIIFETCKTYLLQQGKLLIVLFLFIAACVSFYYGYLLHTSFGGVMLILGWTVIGILGSYSVAWFGIRMNTLANSRMAFASLERKPIKLLNLMRE